jgi:hypothetical protein
MKQRSLRIWQMIVVAVVGLGWGLPASQGQTTNTWILSTIDYWYVNTNWSAGIAPSSTFGLVSIVNTPSKFVAIDSITTASHPGTMTISNLLVTAPVGFSNGLFLIPGATNVPLRILNTCTISTNGALEIEAGTVEMDLVGGSGFLVDGIVDVTGSPGQLKTLNTASDVGASGSGSLTVGSGALWQAQSVNVGANAGSQGTLTIAGGTNTLSGDLSVGNPANATGTVWLTGGLLSTTPTGSSIIGGNGTGRMTVSNGTWNTVQVEVDTQGTLTIAGGTTTIAAGEFYIVGSVWMTGGQLTVTSDSVAIPVYIANNFFSGRMTVSNGTWRAGWVFVGFAGTGGPLTIAGGTSTIRDGLIVGQPGCGSGSVMMNAGILAVTNAAHNAVLDLQGGTFTLSGGTLLVDTLVITNACGRLIKTGGTLSATTTNLAPGLSAVGDSIPNSWKQQYKLNPFDPNLANEDPDGDGQSNLAEYLAGTNPTNPASYFGVTAVTKTNNDIRVTWMTGTGKTNALERTAGVAGSFTTNNFAAIFSVTNTTGTTTNYLNTGAATNPAALFYRVRLVP